MGGDDVDPKAWIRLIGVPMQETVKGLQRAFWWAGGGIFGVGIMLGWLSPYILKKLGLG